MSRICLTHMPARVSSQTNVADKTRCPTPRSLLAKNIVASEKDEVEKELLLLQTKVAIDAERHQIALENLTRARDEATAEVIELKQKFEKEATHHKEVCCLHILLFRLLAYLLCFSLVASGNTSGRAQNRQANSAFGRTQEG